VIPLHLPYYSPSARDAVKNFVLDLNEEDFHSQLSQRFKSDFNFDHTYLTKSCTNALEAIALMLDLDHNDEVIIPSYTFVSTANAFAVYGAKIVYADSENDHPNVSVESILNAITHKTKAIVVMHYGGVAINGLKELRKVCDDRSIFLIEDAAHCIGAYLDNVHLGNFGHASTFSFHESKNLTCVEGGLLVINHEPWLKKIDSILNKGTNRVQFEKKEASFYEWVSLGSSFKMNSMHAVILLEQIKFVKQINDKRIELYDLYANELGSLRSAGKFKYVVPQKEFKHNAHNFWMELGYEKTRNELMAYLKERQIFSTFHYFALHKSPFGKKYHAGNSLPNAEKFEKTLLRLPLYYQQNIEQATMVVAEIKKFFNK
jgi:dTDP-4-amino-4,6-dideoxygalactose transaminase